VGTQMLLRKVKERVANNPLLHDRHIPRLMEQAKAVLMAQQWILLFEAPDGLPIEMSMEAMMHLDVVVAPGSASRLWSFEELKEAYADEWPWDDDTLFNILTGEFVPEGSQRVKEVIGGNVGALGRGDFGRDKFEADEFQRRDSAKRKRPDAWPAKSTSGTNPGSDRPQREPMKLAATVLGVATAAQRSQGKWFNEEDASWYPVCLGCWGIGHRAPKCTVPDVQKAMAGIKPGSEGKLLFPEIQEACKQFKAPWAGYSKK